MFAKPKEAAFAPVTVMLVIARAALPMLVSVTDCDALVVPTAFAPNDRLVADSDAIGAVPVPLSAIVCGEPLTLPVIVIVAVNAPAVFGAKCPWMVQLALTAKLAPQLFAKANEAASVPVTPMLAINSAPVPVLVIVTD